jgi:hypothetical protein
VQRYIVDVRMRDGAKASYCIDANTNGEARFLVEQRQAVKRIVRVRKAPKGWDPRKPNAN